MKKMTKGPGYEILNEKSTKLKTFVFFREKYP